MLLCTECSHLILDNQFVYEFSLNCKYYMCLDCYENYMQEQQDNEEDEDLLS
jgi:hypothetical protein